MFDKVKNPKISVIIPIYILNEELSNITDTCLTSFLRTTPSDVELIVVDDGSPLEYKTDIGNFIKLSSNSGYTVAVNTGFKAAKGQILIVGNNDLVFPENWLTELIFPLNVGFDVASCWTSDQRDIRQEQIIKQDEKFGALFAMNRQIYDSIGGFDEQFRGYFSDTDYRKRMIDAGFKIGKNMNLVVEHSSKSTYSVADPNDNDFLYGQRVFESKYGVAE